VTTHYMDEAERCGEVGYLYLSKMLVSGKPDDLTQLPEVTPEGTRRVEAQCLQGVAAVMGRARELDYVDDATIFGNAVHLLVRRDVPDERIARDLEAAAGAPVAVRQIAATLEDVFVRLTGLQTANDSDAGAGSAGRSPAGAPRTPSSPSSTSSPPPSSPSSPPPSSPSSPPTSAPPSAGGAR